MSDKPEQIETYEKRFGNIAIDKGFITTQQLVESLNIQVMEEIRDGKHRLIGEILLDLKYITLEHVEAVLSELLALGE
jgi:hypothetical protein